MFKKRQVVRRPIEDRRAEEIVIGDATSMTAGGEGPSIEDKRYPYG